METYEIDLTQSVLDDGGSGHVGGGGGNRSDLFPNHYQLMKWRQEQSLL